MVGTHSAPTFWHSRNPKSVAFYSENASSNPTVFSVECMLGKNENTLKEVGIGSPFLSDQQQLNEASNWSEVFFAQPVVPPPSTQRPI